MIAARESDGRFGPSPWKSNDNPGYWQPQLNPDGTPMLDPTPWVGGVRPFLIESATQFRTDGPQALTSAAWAKDFNEVKVLGSVNSTVRTPEQGHIAVWWQSNGGPTLLWNAVARDLVNDASDGVDIVDSALLFAQLNLSGADAAISCWNDKYSWDFWRPWQAIHEADRDGNPAIHEADRDGNPATEPDPSWTPILTAPYPENPSGHLSLDSAHLKVLQMFFGTDEVGFWSVFERRSVTISPALDNSTSPTSSDTSSARRKAPAKPTRSSAIPQAHPGAGQLVQHSL